MQFTVETWAGLASGAITVTFRAWSRPRAKVGAHHKVGDVVLEIDRVDRVSVASITTEDARRAGFDTSEAVIRLLERRADLDADTLIYRVEFHRVGSFRAITGAERAAPGADELADLTVRLQRLDRASRTGPWTTATLRAIADQPGVVSTDLAHELGRERPAFKLDVRKLKRLGLTESLTVGYALTPKGVAVLRHLDAETTP